MSEIETIKQQLKLAIAETNDYRALTALKRIELLEDISKARGREFKPTGLLKDCRKVLTKLGFTDII